MPVPQDRFLDPGSRNFPVAMPNAPIVYWTGLSIHRIAVRHFGQLEPRTLRRDFKALIFAKDEDAAGALVPSDIP